MKTRASLILRHGRVLSPGSPGGFAQSLAAVDERIVALGRDDEVAELVSPATHVIDLDGRLAIPAFGDAHVHAVAAGLESLRCDLAGLDGRHDYLAHIKRYAAALPAGAWVLGGGWSMEAFPSGVPPRGDLDAVTGDHPAFLPNRDHHTAWVNSVALELAGVDATTPDPGDGRIERDRAGRPTGALHDGAMRLVSSLVPVPSPDELDAGLSAALARLHGFGVTHFQDACVGAADELGVPDTFDTYLRAMREGRLSARVRGALWWDRARGAGQIDGLLARRELAPDGSFRATSVKMMLDGVCETFTAAMGQPYLGAPGRQGHRGELFIDPEELREHVAALDAQGFQVHFHAIGDRAVTTALDALEGLGPARRHHIAHLQFIAPGDRDRFARLGVAANFQPLWASHGLQMDELTIPFVGEERSTWQYAIRSLADTGARLAFGSDWPVSSPDPLEEIHVAVNRRPTGPSGNDEPEPFYPDQAIGVDRAIEAFTSGVAWVNGDEGRLGVLAPGRRADVAVLSQDLFSIPAREIADTVVELTIASGAVVHGDE